MINKKNKDKKDIVKHNVVKAALEKNTIKLINAKRVDDAALMINLLQTKDDSRFAICKKCKIDDKVYFSQWIVDNWELTPSKLSNIIDLNDVYISINSLRGYNRKTKNLYSLNGFVVDLDYYKVSELKEKKPEEVIAFLRSKKLFNKLEPSFFVYSGNGLYIVYLLKNASPACAKIWKKIMDALFKIFEQYGADKRSRDIVHVFRLAGTKNSKTGNIARFIYNSTKEFRFEQEKEPIRRYTIADMAGILLPALPYTKEEWLKIKKDKKKKKVDKAKQNQKNNSGNKKIRYIQNLYTLNLNRMLDLETLVDIRNGYCKKNGKLDTEGNREYICLLYRYFNLLCFGDIEKSLQNTLKLNKKFIEPLSDDEVELYTNNVVENYKGWQEAYKLYNAMPEAERPKIGIFFYKYCYTFKNSTIIAELEITKEEMQSLRTIKDRLNTKEHNALYKNYRALYMRNRRKNNNGLTTRQQAKEDKINSIKALLEQGKKQVEIAKIIGITKGMVSRYVKEIKAEKIENWESA